MDGQDHCSCATPDLRTFSEEIICFSCGCPISIIEPEGSSLSKASQSAAFEQFVHQPLIHSTDFRLVRLFSGHPHDPIDFELLRFNLGNHPPYEAVSYTWGDQMITEDIETSAGRLRVTANCMQALLNLRDPLHDRLLWIDAICINQSSNTEKNLQVPLMSRIYAEAKCVLTHLGGYDQDVRNLFSTLREGKIVTSEFEKAFCSSFLSRAWFSRAWVLQEVAVARAAFVVTGPETLPWTYLSPGRMHSLGLRSTDSRGMVPPALVQTEKRPFQDIVSLLNAARSLFSSDPRDKIYALVGLLKNPDELQIIADYNKSVEDLYSEVTLQAIQRYKHLDILADVPGPVHARDAIRRMSSDFQELTEISNGLRRGILSGNHWADSTAHACLNCRSWKEVTEISDVLEGGRRQATWREEMVANFRIFQHVISAITPDGGIPEMDAARIATIRHWIEDSKAIPSDSASDEGFQQIFYNGPYAWRAPEETGLARDCEASQTRGDPDELEIVHRTGRLLPEGADMNYQRQQLFQEISCFKSLVSERIKNELGKVREAVKGFELLGEYRVYTANRESRRREEHALSLPSWVPNFNEHRDLHSLSYWRRPLEASLSNISMVSGNDPSYASKILKVKILKLDSVKDPIPQDFSLDQLRLQVTDTGPGADHVRLYKAFKDSFGTMQYGKNFEDVWEFRKGRKLTLTKRSWAISPGSAEGSDILCILEGASVPFMLREVARDKQTYEVLGESYLHGCRGPKFVDDYLELIGQYRQYFSATTADDLPWETAYLV